MARYPFSAKHTVWYTICGLTMTELALVIKQRCDFTMTKTTNKFWKCASCLLKTWKRIDMKTGVASFDKTTTSPNLYTFSLGRYYYRCVVFIMIFMNNWINALLALTERTLLNDDYFKNSFPMCTHFSAAAMAFSLSLSLFIPYTLVLEQRQQHRQ